MRYLVQFLIPALIVVVTVYLLAKTKRGQDEASDDGGERSDTVTFILILVVGASVAVLSFFLVEAALG